MVGVNKGAVILTEEGRVILVDLEDDVKIVHALNKS